MTFAENLKKSKRFTFRGCEEDGAIAIPKTLFNFMLNISAYCTDEVANEEGFFKNKGAMFEALDLIYQALDEQLTLLIPRSEQGPEMPDANMSKAQVPENLLGVVSGGSLDNSVSPRKEEEATT